MDFILLTGATAVNWGSVAEWASAIATFLAAIVAIVIASWPWISVLLWPPRLTVLFRPLSDCSTFPTNNGMTQWCRIWVDNSDGGARADGAQVVVTRVYRVRDGGIERVHSFVPSNLVWSHDLKGDAGARVERFLGRHCDFGFVGQHFLNESNVILTPALASERPFVVNTIVKPTNRYNALGPGRYKIELRVFADNCKAKYFTVDLLWTGEWRDSTAELLPKELNVSITEGHLPWTDAS